jgi:3-oxoacyl-[acyl-carrier protein] reductase
MYNDLNNKKVLVTGSSSGIGLEIAKSFSEAGSIVAINGRNINNLKKAAKRIYNSKIIYGNVENPKIAKKIVTKAALLLGGIDIIICNVGSGLSHVAGKENYNDWQASMKKNLFSATNIVEASKKYLSKSKGNIICISSICGSEYINGAPITYSVAKSALNSYVRISSQVLGKDQIRINAVAPGDIFFKGSSWEQKLKKNKKKIKKHLNSNVALKKFGNPKSIADICLLLASEKSHFVTGSIWIADGGQIKNLNY